MPKAKRSSDGASAGGQGPRLLGRRAEFEAELDGRISTGRELLERQVRSEDEYECLLADYKTWHEVNTQLITQRFSEQGPAHGYAQDAPHAISMRLSVAQKTDRLAGRIREKVRRLESLREQLPLYPAVERPSQGATVNAGDTPTGAFLVHGHNTAAREEVARFLDNVTPGGATILHEKPNQGQVLLEKFEKHGGSSAFAVVLLTGDDEGRLRSDDEDLQLRARQNVVFELGFFVGTLGRDRVAVLYEAGVELPSDIKGLAYIPLDPHGGWKAQLARELDAVGIEVDPTALLS